MSDDKNIFKNIFFTSDWHVGHQNVIRFDSRPFKDLDHMHRVLINNYNSAVRPQDVCYFLGDMGMTKSEVLARLVSELNGTKILILGNHDKGVNAMYRVGFDVVAYSATLYVANERVTLTHCPLRGVWREDTTGMKNSPQDEPWHGASRESSLRFSVEDEGQFHLHGHIHSPNGGKSQRTLGRQMDVGVAANQYRPVSVSQVESWIAKTRGE